MHCIYFPSLCLLTGKHQIEAFLKENQELPYSWTTIRTKVMNEGMKHRRIFNKGMKDLQDE